MNKLMETTGLLSTEDVSKAASLVSDTISDVTKDTVVEEASLVGKENKVLLASQWKLMWWRFRRHRLALISAIVTILIYLVALFAEFLSPFDASAYSATYTYAPPQTLNLLDNSDGL